MQKVKNIQAKHKIGYKNLIVYQKSRGLTIDLIKYFSKNRLEYVHQFLMHQLLRSASSIGANLTEGYGRHYQKSYRQFIAIARSSSLETDYWLSILNEIRTKDSHAIKSFINTNEEITKMLTVMMKKLEHKT